MGTIAKRTSLPADASIINIYNMREQRCFGPQPGGAVKQKDRRYYSDRLTLPHIVSIGQGKRGSAGLFIRRQVHPGALEFYYVANGIFDIVSGDETHMLKGGDLIRIPPGTQHEGGAIALQKPHFFWIIIRVPSHHERFLGLSVTQTQRLFTSLAALPRRPMQTGAVLKPVFETMLEALIGRNGLAETIVTRNTLDILLRAIASAPAATSSAHADSALKPALSYIHDHITERIGLNDIVSQTGLSREMLRRRFKAAVGIPLYEYIIREKVLAAKERLCTTERAITDIALDLGFSSHSHFSTTFMKWTGCSPQAYRTDNRQNVR
ncbi:MAG: helix-turn-helix transcriptional regulator [Spirochaetes bacterium]|nr:helix-turn-helix transcriptional regulator [Spirochaetota bacterium]